MSTEFFLFLKTFLLLINFCPFSYFLAKTLTEIALTTLKKTAILEKNRNEVESMPIEIQIKPLSSLEKCFLDEDLSAHARRDRFIMLANERLSLQFAVYTPANGTRKTPLAKVTLLGALAPYARVRQVLSVPAYHTYHPGQESDDLLRTAPGLYPDPIRPLHYQNEIPLVNKQTVSLWIDAELPEGYPVGEYDLGVSLTSNDEELARDFVTVRVLNEQLPPQRLIHTEWFYTDCIAEAYHTSAFSKKHWKYIENYLRVAKKNGINMILTPVFTPELDTYIGGYRMTTQLVGITVTSPNCYEFDFSKLEKWIDLCLSIGIEYFEIPHFFTQWGAKNAPKFVAKVNGRTKRIFGWDTDAMGEEYRIFLSQFIPALLGCLKEKGVDKKCFFHVSDEPQLDHLDHYTACKNLLTQHLGEEYPIIDALSDFSFYQSGALKKPVPYIPRIAPFLDAQIDGLWAYYCGSPKYPYAGRDFTMPLYRTRILGVQLWVNNIEGFLHWGYNFYHNRRSYDFVHPLADTSAEAFAPSGDAFLVYPDHDGTAMESLRLNAMREAIDDMRALDLLASKRGRAYAEDLLRSLCGGKLPTFEEYPENADFLLTLRDRIAEELA